MIFSIEYQLHGEDLEAKAIEIAKNGLGEAEIRFAASITAPLFWVIRNSAGDQIQSDSVFFLDTGQDIFAVTAYHVVEKYLADSELPTFFQCSIGGNGQTLPITLRDRIIASNSGGPLIAITIHTARWSTRYRQMADE